MTSNTTHNVISSPVSPDGLWLFDSLDSPQIDRAGRGLAHASPTAAPESKRATPTSATCGPNSTASSGPADQELFSESKSHPLPSSDLLTKTRVCKKCKIEKPYSEFYANSKGNRSRCKDCTKAKSRQDKRRNPELTAARYKAWRDDNRGHALVHVARHRAKVRGMDCNLNPVDIQRRIDAGRCELSGIPFCLSEPRAWNAPSLDRIDSDKGYTTENVRVVLYALNVMANTWGPNRILEIASAIAGKRRTASNALSEAIAKNLKKRMERFGSIEYTTTWSEKTTPSGRSYWEHQASPLRISDPGCIGLLNHWTTPQAHDTNPRGAGNRNNPAAGNACLAWDATLAPWPTPRNEDSESTGAHHGKPDTPHSAAMLTPWCTASARDHKDSPGMATTGVNPDGSERTRLDQLARQAQLVPWPTPMAGTPAQNGNNAAGNNDYSRSVEAVSPWHTPDTAASAPNKGSNCKNVLAGLNNQALGVITKSSTASTANRGAYQLNASFSRWLMGFPATWDEASPKFSDWRDVQERIARGDCADMETQSCPK